MGNTLLAGILLLQHLDIGHRYRHRLRHAACCRDILRHTGQDGHLSACQMASTNNQGMPCGVRHATNTRGGNNIAAGTAPAFHGCGTRRRRTTASEGVGTYPADFLANLNLHPACLRTKDLNVLPRLEMQQWLGIDIAVIAQIGFLHDAGIRSGSDGARAGCGNQQQKCSAKRETEAAQALIHEKKPVHVIAPH